MAILSVGLLAILAVFPVGMQSYREARDQTILANLVRSKVHELLYQLSDPTMGGSGDPSSIIAQRYLRHDRAFAQYMADRRWAGPVYESQVFPFEENDRYYWQYTVTDIGAQGDSRIGPRGVRGVFFQIEFKVYSADQIEDRRTPLDLSVVREDQIEMPIMRQVFRVHNPYPATAHGRRE